MKSGQKWELLSGRGWALALGFSLLLLCAWGGYAPLFNPDEGRYASASLEMARGFDGGAPDWVVPHLNGVPRLNKPPLVYWCCAAAIRLLGDSEMAGRLPSMLAGAGVALLLWAWGRRAVDEATGRLAALVWLSATFPFASARTANTDMLLSAALALATFGVWMAIDGGAAEDDFAPASGRGESLGHSASPLHPSFLRSPELRGGLIAGVGMGLALLAKGPVGALFPLITGLAALVASRRWRVLLSGRVWAALGVALAIALAMAWPWVAAVSARVPGFLRRFLIEENLGRYSGAGGVEFHKPSPPWFYVPVVLLGLLPWSAFLLDGVRPGSERQKRAFWFWGVWALVIIGVFSLSKTKLVSYVLPAFAPLSLLIAAFFAEQMQREAEPPAAGAASQPRAPDPRLWTAALVLTLALQVLLAGVAGFLLMSDKIVPRSQGLPLAIALGVAQAVGAVAIARALADGRRAGGRCLGAGAVFGWTWASAALLHIVLLFGAGRVASYEESGSVMRELRPYLRPSDRVAMLHFQPSTLFYAGRPVTIVDFENTSGLDQAGLAASKYFIRSRPGLLERWRRAPERTFVLCRSNSPGLAELSARWIRIARTNDHLLFCNRDAPPGFSHDFVAPRKQER